MALQCPPWHPGSPVWPRLPAGLQDSTARPQGTAEHDPPASWSSFSRSLQEFSPHPVPSSRNVTPPPNSTSASAGNSLPLGFPDCPLPVLPQSLHFPFPDAALLQRLNKQLPFLMPVPCVSPGLFTRPGPEQALRRDLENSAEPKDTPAWSAGKMTG